MFTRHKLRANALALSLCGSIYPRQQGNHAVDVTVEDALSMLGPMSVGCTCKTDDELHKWVEAQVGRRYTQ